MTDKPPIKAGEWTPVTWGDWQARVDRLAVPGGWLYRWMPDHKEPCLVFVPAPYLPEVIKHTNGGGNGNGG